MTTKNSRTLTSKQVLSYLSINIVELGSTKFKLEGNGTPYIRENDGTAVHIFNVNAFASKAKAEEAGKAWKEGTKLELAGDIDGAQEHFRAAMNCRMSFSVLAENAPAFQSVHEIIGLVEDITNSRGETVRVINRPKPVLTTNAGTSAASFFKLDEPVIETKTRKPKAVKP